MPSVADTGRSFRPENSQQRFLFPNESSYSQTPTIQQKLDELRLLAGEFSSMQDAYNMWNGLISR